MEQRELLAYAVLAVTLLALAAACAYLFARRRRARRKEARGERIDLLKH